MGRQRHTPTRFLILGYFLLAFHLLSFTQIDTTQANEIYAKGLAAYKAGKLDSSLYFWSEASSDYLEIAIEREEKKWWKKFVNSQVNLGSIYQRLGKYEASHGSIDLAIEWGELKLGKWDSTLAHCYWVLGNNYWYQGAYEKAQTCYLQNEKICRKAHPPNHLSIGEAQASIAMIQATMGKYDSAKIRYESAIRIALDAPQASDAFLFRCYNNFANIHKESGDYDKALFYYSQAETLGLESYGPDHPRMTYVFANLGGVYKEFGYFEKALFYMQKSLELNKKTYGDQHTVVVGDLLNLSALYRAQRDYTLALTYGQEAYQVQLAIKDQAPRRWIMCLENLASIHRSIQDFAKAKEIYESILDNQNELIGNKRNIQLIPLLGLGVCYREQSADELALKYFFRGLHLAQSLEYTADDIPGIYKELGITYVQMKKPKKALAHFHMAATQYESLHGHHYPHLSEVYNRMGEVFFNLQSYDSARVYFNLAITANSNSLNPGDSFYDLDLEKDVLLDKHQLLRGLQGMGNTFLKEDTSSITHLSAAEQAFAQAISLIDKMAITYELQQSQLLFQEEIFPIYEEAIATLFHLFQQKKEPHFIEKAFAYSEKSKARFLSETLKREEALYHTGIPDTLQGFEKGLRRKISLYEKEQLAVFYPQNARDSAKHIFLNRKLLSLYSTQDSLFREFKRHYPAYYELSYEPMSYSVAELKATLEEEEAILAYFIGDTWLISFCMRRDTLIGNIQERVPELAQEVLTFHQLMSQPFRRDSASSTEDLYMLAQKLYSLLWAPLSAQLPAKVKVIPDGVLGYIPFDVLITDSGEEGLNTRFLIYDYQISYSYSAYVFKWLTLNRSPALSKTSWVGFAPVFDTSGPSLQKESRKIISPLIHNQEEVENIHRLTSGGIFIGDQASESQFKQWAAQYNLVHIASHAQTNDESPLLSHIAFSPMVDSLEDGVLELGELFNMELDIDMMVLSACETGIGKMQRGEGIVSLARGATFAGAKSIITTLWAVSDQASSKIMYAFYENLIKGQSKDEALRKAKIAYLEHSDKLNAHPFFWGGFIAIGEMRAVFFPMRILFIGVGTMFVLFVGLFFLFRKKIGL